ncbi:hypothetical protein AVEN_274371-1 [Araneus ventricosus]|uniref:Uncharacterized protein n=1 Tax=Araneus ventricosus TaxID=182803 RepID=A0A4Y2MIY1_ARAVE|nr:hypothetical protein AVEN_274371-1 [Araneus ventricosus]
MQTTLPDYDRSDRLGQLRLLLSPQWLFVCSERSGAAQILSGTGHSSVARGGAGAASGVQDPLPGMLRPPIGEILLCGVHVSAFHIHRWGFTAAGIRPAGGLRPLPLTFDHLLMFFQNVGTAPQTLELLDGTPLLSKVQPQYSFRFLIGFGSYRKDRRDCILLRKKGAVLADAFL